MSHEMNTRELATELTVAWLSNPNTRASADDVTAFLLTVRASLDGLTTGVETVAAQEPASHEPAVTVRKSLASPDRIISLITGESYKTLRRHLNMHGLTPQQYRERYNLKADYPMVAANYSEVRRAMAMRIGLGRKPKAQAEASSSSIKGPTKKPTAKKSIAKANES